MTALASLPTDAKLGASATAASTTIALTGYVETILPAGETIYFQERGVALTEHHALLNFKAYPLRDIYGASLRELPRNQSVVLGIIVLGTMLAALTSSVSFTAAMVILAVTGLLALGLRLSVRTDHVLRLTTPEGERDVLMSHDRTYLTRVFEALNGALAEAHREPQAG
jgi:hypothetical protein